MRSSSASVMWGSWRRCSTARDSAPRAASRSTWLRNASRNLSANGLIASGMSAVARGMSCSMTSVLVEA